MSRWTISFETPKVLQSAKSALEAIQLDKEKSASLPVPVKEEYDRAVKVLRLIVARLSALDPELFHLNSWTNVTNWLNQAKLQADAFRPSLNPGNIQALNSQLDEVLNSLKPIDGHFSDKEYDAITEIIERYNQETLEALQEVRKRAETIQKSFDSLSGDISQGKARLEKNDQIIESQKARLDSSIAEFQKQFSAAQESRSLDFQVLLTQIKTASESQAKTIEENTNLASEARKSEWDKCLAASIQQSNQHLDFLKKRKKEVDDIFGAIGSAALAGNFSETANIEKQAADAWRKLAFGFMVAMGIVAIAAFASTFLKSPDWETFLFRIGTALIIAVPAFYAANESSKHRNQEKLIRKNFLELSAIDAYLVHLPEQERNQIKGKLSDKFFGVPEIQEKTESVSKKDLFGLVENIIKNVTKGH
jgi:hypothetical protein